FGMASMISRSSAARSATSASSLACPSPSLRLSSASCSAVVASPSRRARPTSTDSRFTSARRASTSASAARWRASSSRARSTAEGYRRPEAGTVRVLGCDPVRDHAAVVPRIGVMPQDGGVYPGIRVSEALRLFAAYYDDPLDPAALLEKVGLVDRASAATRSL